MITNNFSFIFTSSELRNSLKRNINKIINLDISRSLYCSQYKGDGGSGWDVYKYFCVFNIKSKNEKKKNYVATDKNQNKAWMSSRRRIIFTQKCHHYLKMLGRLWHSNHKQFRDVLIRYKWGNFSPWVLFEKTPISLVRNVFNKSWNYN